jgi:hypothetical protein
MPLRKKTQSDEVPPIVGGAFVTAVLMYPVDVVRAICMANPGQSTLASLQWFIRENGWSGFAKQGLVPEVARATLARGIKFTALNPIHNTLFGGDFSEGSMVSRGITGSLSTIPEIIVCSPFENVKLAEQLAKDPALKIPDGKFRTSLDVGKYIIGQRGSFSLWTGYAGMQGRQMLWSGVYFGTVRDVVKKVEEVSPVPSPTFNKLLGGFMCGSFAALFSCPLDVCRTGIQKSQMAQVFQPVSAAGEAKMTFWCVTGGDIAAIAKEGAAITGRAGAVGLWAGIAPKMAYLGGGGAILAWIMPVLKQQWFAMNNIEY